MKIVTPGQMSKIDSISINQFGIPGVVLMENAALKVVEEIVKSLKQVQDRTVFLFAGKGNNGGDAFAAARHLYNKNIEVRVYVIAKKDSIKGDAEINLKILENLGIDVIELLNESHLEKLKSDILKADLVVDGIFGTGLNGDVRGMAAGVIETINSAEKQVVAVDIPSGVNGDSGKVLGVCVKANKTVTFGLPKIGLVIHPGCEYVGELVVADIGIPVKVEESIDITTNLIESRHVSGLLPTRHRRSSKGDYGKIFILTGSTGMTGAGLLTGGAALRVGAGLVYMGVPSALSSIYDSTFVEGITIPLEDKGTGCLSKDSLGYIIEKMDGKTVVAAGPGLSVSEDTIRIVEGIVLNSSIPLVLDADALNALSRDIRILKDLKTEAVLTPHPGEMGRLTGVSIEDIQNNRLEVAREFSCRWNVITVLKGARTVVALPDGDIYINAVGNPGMATGGSGDVLTGVIAGLISQGMRPSDAAVAGVHIHAIAGDCVAEDKGQHGLVAGDIMYQLPYVIKRMAQSGNL